MYKLLDALDEEKLQNLVELQETVKMRDATSHRRRVGENGPKNLSNYSVSKYLSWKVAQRKKFLENFPTKASEKSTVKWFQEFPEKVGHLDLMTVWKDDTSPNWITAFCLSGQGGITFNGKDVAVPVGQGITYSLDELHKVKATDEGSVWACAMTRQNVW